MKQITSVLAAAVALALPLASHAVSVVYQGALVSGVPATGSAGGLSWFLDQGAGVQYWSFTVAPAGANVTLAVDRLNANFDPGLSLYAGQTSADTSAFQSGGSWGGMSYVGSLDDEHAPFMSPGPNGDPFGTFTLNTGGVYTVAVGGSLSTDAGAYPYRITMTLAPVPEPTAALMLAAGLAALAGLRSRRR
jgi:hypothetical protein